MRSHHPQSSDTRTADDIWLTPSGFVRFVGLGALQPEATTRGARTRSVMAGALLAAILSSLAVGLLTHLWDQPLHVPFQYAHAPGDDEEDATLDLMLIKNVHETGWFNTNRKLNAPFEQHWAEWPMGGDLLSYTVKKAIVDVTDDVPLTFNLFWLLTFPLTALAAFPALRSLRVSWSGAIVGAVVFSLAPYHFRNGAGHENLALYVGVPTIVLICVRILGPDAAIPSARDLRTRDGWWRLRWPLLGTVLIGVTGIYYLAFLLSLVALCAVVGALSRRRPGRLVLALVFGVVGVLASAVANLPTLLYRWSHVPNLLGVPDRRLGISETYPLRIVELLSPVTAHRFGPFAFIADQLYAPRDRGMGTAMLGLAGSIGLVIAVAAVLVRAMRRSRESRWSYEARIGIVIIAALILGTAGGFGRALELAGLSGVRAWSRIAIVVAFASIVVFARSLDRVRITLTRRGRPMSRRVVVLSVGAIIVIAALDQASPALLPDPSARADGWKADQQFVTDLERQLPRDAMVFQLPVVDFPEHSSILDMSAHDLIKAGYLHSHTARWSTGGVRGRSGEWQWPAAKLRTRTLVRGLRAVGFTAITVDRNGYDDFGEQRVRALSSILGAPIAHDGRHVLAWDLRRGASATVPDPAARRATARRLLHAPLLYLSTDVDPIRNRGSDQPVCGSGTIVAVNPAHHETHTTLRLHFTPKEPVDPVGRLKIGTRRVRIVIGHERSSGFRARSTQDVGLELAPGQTRIDLAVHAPHTRCASVQLNSLTTVSASLVPRDQPGG